MIKLKNNSEIFIGTAGEPIRAGDMITLAHKTEDWNCPSPQEEDEMVCVKVKVENDMPIGVVGEDSKVLESGTFLVKLV